jgi:hypothetical protein
VHARWPEIPGRTGISCGVGQTGGRSDDWEEWKALLVEAGITKNARLHDARDTCGTLLGEHQVGLNTFG